MYALLSAKDGFLRFSSDVTPANIFVTSMVADPFTHIFFQALVVVESME